MTALAGGPARAGLLDSVPTPTPRPLAGTLPPVAGAFLFYEDFEKGMAGMKRWTISGPARDVAWRLLEARTCGGQFTMHLGRPKQATFQAARGDSYLTLSAPLDLRTAKKPTLKYDVKGVANPPEAVRYQAEIRPAGGKWTPLGPVIEGRFVLMQSIYLDISRYAGQPLGLRFHAWTQPGREPSKGLYLDDVFVIEPQR
jgi:hypothetical protein